MTTSRYQTPPGVSSDMSSPGCICEPHEDCPEWCGSDCAECDLARDAISEAELYAEGSWVRAREAGLDEELERMRA